IGRQITGYFVSVSQGSTVIGTCFTPQSCLLTSSQPYSIAGSSFDPYNFDYWADTNSTADPRTISISTDMVMTAVYRNTAIWVSPPTDSVGMQVTVSGTQFTASSSISITFDGVVMATNPASIVTNSTGGFSDATFTVPNNAPDGQHQVIVSDNASAPISYAA